MPRKNSYLTVTDQFCGAGGSSQGAQAAGVEVKVALNHWELAIETHSTNFPKALHDCTDASACDPRRYPSTDGLITSPECKTHTPAGGNCHKKVKEQMELFEKNIIDPATERSRATMWDVPRFAEYHNYNFIVVENVIEAKTRWPLFDTWLRAMYVLGYKHKCCYFNSMHFHPTPQSRDRMFIVFWKKGNKAPNLNHSPKAFCQHCNTDVLSIQSWKDPAVKFGKYQKQYIYCCPTCGHHVQPYYYAAFNCIDWSDRGTRIGDRKKPLADKTMSRIAYGDKKYRDFPFVLKLEHSGALLNNNVRSAFNVLQTQTTTQGMALAIPPFIVENNGQSLVRDIDRPFGTITTKIKHGIITTENWQSFISYYYRTAQATHITEPFRTIRTNDCHQLISHPEKADLNDYYYRMLKADEAKLAMAFNKDYVILGTQEDQVKQCGNAVTPPVMQFLISRLKESLS